MRFRELLPVWTRLRLRLIRAWFLSRGLNGCGPFELPKLERGATASISIIVPVHDAPAVTKRCLNSLKRFGGAAEVIVVDDGSKLEATQRVLDQFVANREWKMMKNDEALGHSRASEKGVAASTRPYLCLLNSDTVITPRSWAGVIAAFQSNQTIGIAGPATSLTVGPQTVNRACHCRHYWSDEQIWSFAERYARRHHESPPIEVPFVGGFAFFIRRTLWAELNGFDVNLADYGNEMEFCRRAVKSGVRIVYSNASYIHHLGSESYGRTIGEAIILKRGLEAKAYVDRRHGGNG